MAEQHGIPFVETSAKMNQNVADGFETIGERRVCIAIHCVSFCLANVSTSKNSSSHCLIFIDFFLRRSSYRR